MNEPGKRRNTHYLNWVMPVARFMAGLIGTGSYLLLLHQRIDVYEELQWSWQYLYSFPVFGFILAYTILFFLFSVVWHLLMNASWNEAVRVASRCFSVSGLLILIPIAEFRFLNSIDDVVISMVSILIIMRLWKDIKKNPRITSLQEVVKGTLVNSPKKTALLVACLCLIVPLLYTFDVFEERRHPVGDEPSYLTIAHSIAFDHDIRVQNNYAARVYQRYFEGKYKGFAHLGKDGHWYPHHSIGLPILLTAPYRVFFSLSDRLFVQVIRVYLALWYALLAYHVYLLALRLVQRPGIAMLSVLLGFHCTPLLFYATEIYPELIAGLCLVIAARAFLMERFSRNHALLCGAFAAVLPWFGIKYIALSVTLLALFFFKLISSRRKVYLTAEFLLPVLVSAGMYASFLYRLYGTISPESIYTGVSQENTDDTSGKIAQPTDAGSYLRRIARDTYELWLGILLEQRMGLIILAPLFLYALWGWILLVFKRSSAVLYLGLPVFLHLLVYGYQANWGGYCPPNRPIVAVLPLFIPALAVGLSSISSRLHRVLFPVLTSISMLISLIYLYHSRWLYQTLNPNVSGGSSVLLQSLSMPFGIDLPAYFPLIMGAQKQLLPNGLFLGMLVLVLLSLLFFARQYREDEIDQSFSLAQLYPQTRKYQSLMFWIFFVSILCYRWWSLPGHRFKTVFSDAAVPYAIYTSDGSFYYNDPGGIWLKAGANSEIIIETEQPITLITVRGYSLIKNSIRIAYQEDSKIAHINASEWFEYQLKPYHLIKRNGFHYLKLRLSCQTGVMPDQLYQSKDFRQLGVFFSIAIQK